MEGAVFWQPSSTHTDPPPTCTQNATCRLASSCTHPSRPLKSTAPCPCARSCCARVSAFVAALLLCFRFSPWLPLPLPTRMELLRSGRYLDMSLKLMCSCCSHLPPPLRAPLLLPRFGFGPALPLPAVGAAGLQRGDIRLLYARLSPHAMLNSAFSYVSATVLCCLQCSKLT